MLLRIKDLQIYLGHSSPATAYRFKKKVLYWSCKDSAKCSKKNEITAIDVANYHNITLAEVLTVIKSGK